MLLQQAGSAEEKVSGKTFEEVIGELDEEINKYDSKSSMAIRVDVNTEKENVGDQHTINEASMPCSPSHATNITTKKHAMLTKSCNQYHYKKNCYLRRNFFDDYKKLSEKIAFSTASLFR